MAAGATMLARFEVLPISPRKLAATLVEGAKVESVTGAGQVDFSAHLPVETSSPPSEPRLPAAASAAVDASVHPAEVCRVPAMVAADASTSNFAELAAHGGFGLALAKAATAQLEDLVVYDPRYRAIAYPMGDVPSLFGVCTDVVV
ncbi:MAG TPA: DUF1287 domain-containing protein, partial [Hyphomicrobiaceae bacterium]|nr:DUF1287 domain-containing protein [Hyphomicrobiaceae bacterium]